MTRTAIEIASAKSNDGGPAFPRPYGTDEHSGPCNSNADQQGMTLRQHIVIELVAALISYEGPHAEGYEGNHVAQAARYADVMIAEDNK